MIIRACDLEATGKDPTDEIVEIGCYDIDDVLSIAPTISNGRRTFVRPARPVPSGSSGIHHITDADVAHAPTWADAWGMLVETEIGEDGAEMKFAAHFASYERQFLDPLIKADWIDTWKCSLRQWPDIEDHKLQTLRYALRLPVDQDLAMPPHRALPDAYACGVLVIELLKYQSIETLIQWSNEPAILTKFDFGRFNGQPLSAADDGFLNWMLDKDFSEDWKWNVRREIDRRTAAKRDSRIKKWVDGVRSAATVRDLENWWHGEAEAFAAERIIPGTEEYTLLIGEASARKAALLAAAGPVFESSGGPT